MFKVQMTEEDANRHGIIIGLPLPLKHQTRLGVVGLFIRLERSLSDHEDCPEDFTIWPVSIIMPCRKIYLYKGPDDFPLEDVPCRCKNAKHRPVIWRRKPSKRLDGI